MKVSYEWLSQYIDLTGISPEELAEKLTLSGIEVDHMIKRNQGVKNVVVGYVTDKEKHPEADRLSVCQVDVGEEQLLQIVCGAQNVAKGQKVPVALIGAELPGDFKIKRTKLRGMESQGMICSAQELGIEDRLLPKEIQEGILVLPESLEVGEDVLPLLGLGDTVLELDLTPNRSDCLSLIGVAYEVAAIVNRDVKLPNVEIAESDAGEKKFTITNEAPEACFDYSARLIRGVKIGPSPLWLQNYLMAAGVRPINNIVDITNFVMFEYGQPLHAFDAQKFMTGEVKVRLAQQGETIITLDGVERQLDEGMLLITDGGNPVGIGGVMGGENSEVTDATTDILLESAYFKGISIRRTSSKLGLRSEASIRFEKGVDPNYVIPALNRATALIVQLAGGEVVGGILGDQIEEKYPHREVSLSPQRLNQVLGTDFTTAFIVETLQRLQFTVEEKDGKLVVSVPTRRQDISIEADLIEEVARLAGYEHIPTTLPIGEDTPGGLSESQQLRRSLKRTLASLGYNQVVTYSLVNPKMEELFAPIGSKVEAATLALPMSEEHNTLRTNLLPSLLKVAQYNANRNLEDIALFEMGKVYLPAGIPLTSQPREEHWLAGLVMGEIDPTTWQGKGRAVDFYAIKGILETLIDQLRITGISYHADAIKGLHPGRGAWLHLDGEPIGYLGQLHPELQKSYDLKESYVFQLNLEGILAREVEVLTYQPLPRYPAIQRDLALVVAEEVKAGDLLSGIKAQAGQWLEEIEIFDLYQGEHIEKGKKSIAFSLTYRHPERTLQDEEVQKAIEEVLKYLQSNYQAEIRS